MKTYKFTERKQKFEFNYINESYMELHDHDYYEFSIVTKGEMIHHINGDTRKVYENTLLLLRPKDSHYITVEEDKKTFELFTLNVSKKFFTSFFELIDKELFDRLDQSELIEIPIANTSNRYFSNFISKTSTIYQNNNYPEEILSPIFLDLSSIVLHYYQDKIVSRNYSIVVNTMMELLHDKKNFSLSLSEISKKANYSYAHINRLFKSETGTTLAEYFASIRLEYAKRLIETTSYSIMDISIEVGFQSLSHFTKLFSKYYGNTPAKHRKTWNTLE